MPAVVFQLFVPILLNLIFCQLMEHPILFALLLSPQWFPLNFVTPSAGTEEPVSKHSFAPSGAWNVRDTSIPAINRWAIFAHPSAGIKALKS